MPGTGLGKDEQRAGGIRGRRQRSHKQACIKNSVNFKEEKMKELETLGRNIKRYRQFKELTQTELAAKVGLNKDTISKIELGKLKNPGLKHLTRISQELNVTLEELFMEEAKFIKLVISDQNARSLERIFNEITRRLAKKEESK